MSHNKYFGGMSHNKYFGGVFGNRSDLSLICDCHGRYPSYSFLVDLKALYKLAGFGVYFHNQTLVLFSNTSYNDMSTFPMKSYDVGFIDCLQLKLPKMFPVFHRRCESGDPPYPMP